MPLLPLMRPAIVVLAVTLIAGCAAVQVRAVGTNTGQAAFDLSGPSLAELSAEAHQLCPHDYAVMRQWERISRPAGAQADAWSGAAASAWVLTYDQPRDQAQMSIVCGAQAPG